MPELTLQNHEEGKSDFPERAPFENNSVFEAVVLECTVQDSRWDIDEDDPSKGKKQQLSFKFEVIDPQGNYDKRWVWGNCSAYLSTDPRNKLRQWTQGILDLDVLPEGFALNTDDLVGKQARIVIGAKPKADGSGRISNFVVEVRPTKTHAPAVTAAQFREQNAPVDEDLEPF